MVARNEKSAMKLITKVANFQTDVAFRVPVAGKFKKFKGFVWLGGKPHSNPLNFSNFQTHKISRLSNSGLKIGNLSY